MKNRFFRTSVVLMSGIILGGFIAPVSASAAANENVSEQQTSNSNSNDQESQDDIDQQVFNGETSLANTLNTLSDSDKQDFSDQSYLEELTNKVNLMTCNTDKVDPIYIQEHQYDSFGKFGLTAKAAAKVLKAALHKLGRKGYDKIANSTGLGLVKLNFKTMTKIVDYLDNFDGQAGDVLKKILMKYLHFNNFWAGLTAGTITTIFL